MGIDHELNEAEKTIIERLGTIEDVKQKISAAELKSDYVLAYSIAYDADHYGIVNHSEKLDDLMGKIDALQKQS